MINKGEIVQTTHLSITKNNKKKLKEYGKGCMSEGIVNIIQLIESKTIQVIIITEININGE